VQVLRTGLINPNLGFIVEDVGTKRFGGKVVQSTPDTSQSYNTFDGTFNSQLEVRIITDAAWDQTTSDVHVQVVFFG
jgi:hypothetical protein